MNKCSPGVFKPLRCALLSTNQPWQERVSFSYETGLEWILEQRKHKDTVCRKVEQTEKRLKTTRAPTVTSCLDILALKYNDSSNRGCEALLMTNILMEAFFHHLCCRCILKGGISGVVVPGTGEFMLWYINQLGSLQYYLQYLFIYLLSRTMKLSFVFLNDFQSPFYPLIIWYCLWLGIVCCRRRVTWLYKDGF